MAIKPELADDILQLVCTAADVDGAMLVVFEPNARQFDFSVHLTKALNRPEAVRALRLIADKLEAGIQ